MLNNDNSINAKYVHKLTGKPLIFGDSEQLRVLREWRAELDKAERESGHLYEIQFTYRVDEVEIVRAQSEMAAKRIIQDSGYDDVEIMFIRKLNE